MTYTPHVSEYKKNEVADVRRLFEEYPVVGVVNLDGLPAEQYMAIKHKFKDRAYIKFTKKSFMTRALESIKKPNINELRDALEGVPALVFTKEDPFIFYNSLEKSKISAAARAGQKAPDDIIVNAGPTPFTPGPIIGELGQLGFKTEVKDGKIAIKEDKVLVKVGQEINQKVADLLSKLGIEPMKIGLNVTLMYQNGFVYKKEALAIDEEEYMNNLKLAAAQAFNLAMFASYTTKDTVQAQLMKAYWHAKSLADTSSYMTGENTAQLLKSAEASAENLASAVPENVMKPEEQSTTETTITGETVNAPEASFAPEPVTSADTTTLSFADVGASAVHNAFTNAPSATPAVVIESKEPINEADMKQAEKVLNDIYDKHVKLDPKEGGSRKQFQQQETDINKIINSLKDKKSRGEI